MRKLITVTRDHIRKGVVNDEECCPIALALQEAGSGGVKVKRHNILFYGEPIPLVTWLPQSAMRFIKRFDDGEHVEPFKFYVPYWGV